ncbi:hypothetical protein P4S70_03890 [Enterovibrio sp. Hal110]
MTRTIQTLLITLFVLAGCSPDIGRTYADNECSKIRNNTDRDRDQCYMDIERTFEHYPEQ